jgi:prepilin-type N-terminal cleavage/methylation domain-containing protein
MKGQKGFSLVELLVVVIIIAIVAAIAIPNLLASRRSANEASAISSLRTIHSAEATYQAVYGGNVDYGSLSQLAGQNLIDSVLGGPSGTKSGYTFTSSVGAAASQLYCAAAQATTQDTSGVRSFGVNQTGVIYYWTGAGSTAACASGALATSGAAGPIQ